MQHPDILSFHVYRVGGFLSDDRVIKGKDKVTHLYYLKGSRDDTHWHFELHANGPHGALICQVSSGYLGPPTLCGLPSGSIVVNITCERKPIRIESRRGASEGTHWFRGPDERDYQWRSNPRVWRNEMQCVDEGGDIVASYRATAMAISKDGELSIYPSGHFMTDLLVATILAIQTPNH